MSKILSVDERFEQTRNLVARELQAMCNEGVYGTCMAMAICVQMLRLIFTETKQPPEVIERIAQIIVTPGTSVDYLMQRPS